MKNNSKQQAVRKAYNNILQNVSAKYKKQVTSNINEDGWCTMLDEYDSKNLKSPSFIYLGYSQDFVRKSIDTKIIKGSFLWRPKSLSGLEDNNGWIKFEIDKDLPNSGSYFVVYKTGELSSFYLDKKHFNNDHYWIDNITHYQPITIPKPPIY